MIDLYYKRLIGEIEEKLRRLYKKYYSKNIFDIINKNTYKIYINRYDNLLLDCYKNIERFMMKEKINNCFLELNSQEYKQLNVFNALSLYEKTYKNLLKKNQSFSKIDVMWSVYNELALKYEYTKDTSMLSIVLERETDILINEKKYAQALDVYLCSLYCLFYNYKINTNSDINIFDRHLNNKRKLKFKDLILKNSINSDNIIDNFQFIISNNIHSLYDEEKTKFIINNILRRIEL